MAKVGRGRARYLRIAIFVTTAILRHLATTTVVDDMGEDQKLSNYSTSKLTHIANAQRLRLE